MHLSGSAGDSTVPWEQSTPWKKHQPLDNCYWFTTGSTLGTETRIQYSSRTVQIYKNERSCNSQSVPQAYLCSSSTQKSSSKSSQRHPALNTNQQERLQTWIRLSIDISCPSRSTTTATGRTNIKVSINGNSTRSISDVVQSTVQHKLYWMKHFNAEGARSSST